MKKKIGTIAAVVAVIDFFVYLFILVSGNAFTYRSLTSFVFILWFVCLAVAIPCLLGDFIKFIGKQFSAGYTSSSVSQTNGSVVCSKCGKEIDTSVTFCPHCGEKRQ